MLDQITEMETLPLGNEDEIIPTRLARIDSNIVFLKEQLDAIQRQLNESQIDRNILINRARELHITTDNEYKIVEIPIYPKKRVDINILKKYEDKYKLILANIASRIKDKALAEAAKAELFVSQADVKSVISDKAILAMIIPEPKEPDHYEVTVVKR